MLGRLQAMMWENAGLLRDGLRLQSAIDELRGLERQLPRVVDRQTLELKNLHAIAELIVKPALAREESRGAHYRNDFPSRDDQHFQKHSVMKSQDTVRFEELGVVAN